jgi:endonuclease III
MARHAFNVSDVKDVVAALQNRFGDWDHYNRRNPLHELLFIICSIQTNELLYRDTFALLRKRFPSMAALHAASEQDIAKALLRGGLSNQRARKIKILLGQINKRFGKVSLSELKRMTDVERERELTSLLGVGNKTARCVMLYSFGSRVFPVDSNCWRICRRLGWVRATRPDKSCSPADMDRLQNKIPADHRYSLHVNMVSLGRTICTSANAKCDICPIRQFCRSGAVRSRST